MVKKVDSESSFMNIAVESTSSIADVKQCIDRMQRGKLSPEINLYFNGKLLKDNSTLSDKGVVPLSTLEFAEVLCLHIWLSSGETTSIHVLTSDEIGDVKNRIMRMEHLRRGHYALKFSGQRLEETKRISDYDIPYGSTLLLQEVFSKVSYMYIQWGLYRAPLDQLYLSLVGRYPVFGG